MDAKALAKSKRAHSQRHAKRNNFRSGLKGPSFSPGAATGSKEAIGEKVGENLQQHHGFRELPSNSDRYVEEFDLGSGDPLGQGSGQPDGFVAPKSKGADFSFLISEARSQPQPNYSADIIPWADDVREGFGLMLSTKGQSLFSWIADNDFDFDLEDRASTSYENEQAPFLSLDLHALAKKLEITKLSERLFVDPDVLPPELLDDALKPCGEDSHGHVRTSSTAVEINSKAAALSQNDEKNKHYQLPHEPMLSASTASTDNFTIAAAKEGLHSTNQLVDDLRKVQESEQKSSTKSSMIDSAARKPVIFEAANAEAELDMLLTSFSEAKFLEPSTVGKESCNEFGLFQNHIPSTPSKGISSLSYASTDIEMKKGADASKSPSNLFKETSNEVKTFPNGKKTNANTSSTSKVLDDFDSWLDSI